ncbi:thiosulfate sulfurtransferase GlpE [Idiomarina seosinensis]|uniref:Thiosulfate sulfurtransferase GlpE n=1 Tax=Idiomarina seosinensis TaxID=281739 RepID=A0A432ZDJ0_9GAMM|nr:thiosulfate sulfurtransferase GlpE [Idiomarina seosinensis]RUO76016.1 thiosulfate sulfurtransferase GlpE [Idiomarina seosinensis]
MAQEITLTEAHQQWQQQDAATVFVDIRDSQSFAQAHIPGAQPLNNDNVAQFIQSTAASTPIVVVCYHGISSHQAADVLEQQGLTQVASMQGGFTAWQAQFPNDTTGS